MRLPVVQCRYFQPQHHPTDLDTTQNTLDEASPPPSLDIDAAGICICGSLSSGTRSGGQTPDDPPVRCLNPPDSTRLASSPAGVQYPRPCRRRRRARCSQAERLSRPGEQQNQNPRTRQANRAPGSLVGESPEAVVCAPSLAHLLSLHSASSPWLAL